MSDKIDNGYFLFYKSFYEAFCDLPPEEQSSFIHAICRWGLFKEPFPLESPASRACFNLVKPILEAGLKRRKNGSMPPKEGKKRGRPKKEKTIGFQEQKPKDKDKEKDKEKEKDNEKEKSKANKQKAPFL